MQSLTLDRDQRLLGGVWGRIEGPEGDRNATGRPTVSTNLDPWELSETELPTKEPIGAGPGLPGQMYQRTALSGLRGRRCA